MANPIVKKDGKWYNKKTGHFLSDSYGRRLHLYFKRFPDTTLKDARGHKKRTGPNSGQNLKTWSWKELNRLGVL